jgi:hypothetical protein
MVLAISRAIVFLIGVVAFYVSVFMHEDEQGRLQNRIDELWVAIDDRQKLVGSRAAAVFNKVAGVVSNAFDRIFGRKLISIQLVGVSTSLAFAGMFLGLGFVLAFLLHLLRKLPVYPPNLPPSFGASLSLVTGFLLIVGSVLFVIGALPSVLPYRIVRIFSLLPAVVSIGGAIRLALHHLPIGEQLGLLAALFIGVFFDIALLAGVRKSLRWMKEQNDAIRICLTMVAHIAMAIVIVWVPMDLAVAVKAKFPSKALQNFLFGIGAFNLFTSAVACTFVITLLFVFLHRIFWPVLERLVYPFARYRVVRNPKAMATIGAACVVFALPSLRGVVASILAWLVSVFSGQSKMNHS